MVGFLLWRDCRGGALSTCLRAALLCSLVILFFPLLSYLEARILTSFRYPVAGFSFSPSVAGPVYLQMTLYEFLYTGIGQFVAAYAPNAVFAALVNPLLIAGEWLTFV